GGWTVWMASCGPGPRVVFPNSFCGKSLDGLPGASKFYTHPSSAARSTTGCRQTPGGVVPNPLLSNLFMACLALASSTHPHGPLQFSAVPLPTLLLRMCRTVPQPGAAHSASLVILSPLSQPLEKKPPLHSSLSGLQSILINCVDWECLVVSSSELPVQNNLNDSVSLVGRRYDRKKAM